MSSRRADSCWVYWSTSLQSRTQFQCQTISGKNALKGALVGKRGLIERRCTKANHGNRLNKQHGDDALMLSYAEATPKTPIHFFLPCSLHQVCLALHLSSLVETMPLSSKHAATEKCRKSAPSKGYCSNVRDSCYAERSIGYEERKRVSSCVASCVADVSWSVFVA